MATRVDAGRATRAFHEERGGPGYAARGFHEERGGAWRGDAGRATRAFHGERGGAWRGGPRVLFTRTGRAEPGRAGLRHATRGFHEERGEAAGPREVSRGSMLGVAMRAGSRLLFTRKEAGRGVAGQGAAVPGRACHACFFLSP